MSFRLGCKTSFGHLQDVFARCLPCLDKTSYRCLFADWERTRIKNLLGKLEWLKKLSREQMTIFNGAVQ